LNADFSHYNQCLRKKLGDDLDLYAGNYVFGPHLPRSDCTTPGSIRRAVSNLSPSSNIESNEDMFASSTNWCKAQFDIEFEGAEFVSTYPHQNSLPFMINLAKIFKKGNGDIGLCIISRKHPENDDLITAD
jgi:hypothetical protein